MKTVMFFIVLLLILIAGLLIIQRCEGDENLNSLRKAFKQNTEDIAKINTGIADILDSVAILKEQRISKINYYNSEVTKIESVYAYNGSISEFDSIIRKWADEIYNTPGFFRIELDSTGAIPSRTYNTPIFELVLPSDIPDVGEQTDDGSSW